MEWRTLPFPLKVKFVSWVYVIPMLFAEHPSNAENLCSYIDDSLNLNVTHKNISLIYPINSMAAFGWRTGNYACWVGFGAGAGAGSMSDLGARGGSAVSPLQEFKGLAFWAQDHSCPIYPKPWQL